MSVAPFPGMRISRVFTSILAILAVSFSLVAFAGEPPAGSPAPKQRIPASKILNGKVEHERPNWGSKDAPSFARGKTVNGKSYNSEPVVAKNKAGRYYDKRTGRLLSGEQAEEAKKWQEGYESKHDVALISGDTGEQSVGINVGPIKNGRVNLAEGDLGEVNLDVGRATGQATGSVGITKDGVQAEGELKGQVTLVGISAESKKFALGDPDGLNNASTQETAQAYIGAEGDLNGHVGVTKNGVGGAANAEVFAGGKAEVQSNNTVTICGVEVNLQAQAEASYGIGAHASGQFSIDWSKMTVKIGASAGLTVGGGAGAGTTIEVSLAKVLQSPGKAAECVKEHLLAAGKWVAEKGGELVDAAGNLASKGIDKLSSAASSVKDTIGGGLSSAGHFIGGLFGGGGHDDPPAPTTPVSVASFGNQTPRNANTIGPVVSAPPAGTPAGGSFPGSSHAGAGVKH